MAGGINSRKPQAAAASASGGAIGDNSSTLEDAAACAIGSCAIRMFRSFNRCFPWNFVLVLRVSSTRTRTRRYGIEYEYEYHFIEYEYDKSQKQRNFKTCASGELLGIILYTGRPSL